jgi:hypothetical protein
VEEALKAWDFIASTGCLSWIDWNLKHWGCKYEAQVHAPTTLPKMISFQIETYPQRTPRPIWLALAKQWPQLVITCTG